MPVVDLTTVNILVIIGNMMMSGVLVYYYRYRAKIEEIQIKLLEENYESRKCLRNFRKYINAEGDELKKMSPEDLNRFMDFLKHLGEDEE